MFVSAGPLQLTKEDESTGYRLARSSAEIAEGCEKSRYREAPVNEDDFMLRLLVAFTAVGAVMIPSASAFSPKAPPTAHIAVPKAAQIDKKCKTKACHKRVVLKVRASCSSKTCKARVAKKRARVAERKEFARYKANPLPYCTWGPESGGPWNGSGPRPEWHITRYRQPAIGQGPVAGGGKFQIIDSTWAAYGGLRYAAHAQHAKPVYQERIARRIYAGQGPKAWTNC